MSQVEAEVRRFGKKIENDLSPDVKPGVPAGPAAPASGTPRIVARGRDFETRAQVLGEQARSAGATRTENEADLLGFVLPRRRVGQARALLG